MDAPCFSLSRWRERAGLRAAFLAPLLLSACGTPTACLANRYDTASPQARCISGVQLPDGLLKDTDPMSGSTAPVQPAS
jgi:hypothetical protein